MVIVDFQRDPLSRQLSLQYLINRESLSIHNKFAASFYQSEGVCQAQWWQDWWYRGNAFCVS